MKDEETTATQKHLIKLQTYLSKHLYNRPGVQCIRNELLTTYFKSSGDVNIDGFKRNKTCPRCFNVWNENNFSIKTKTKKSKSRVNRRMMVKCLVCYKYCSIDNSTTKQDRKISQIRKTNQYRMAGEINKTSVVKRRKRKLKMTATSDSRKTYSEAQKRKSLQNAPTSNHLANSPTKRGKRKSKMISKSNRAGTSDVHKTTGIKRKKVALDVLNDLL